MTITRKISPAAAAQAGSQRASRRAVDSSARTIRDSLCLIQGRAVRVQHTGSHNTDYRIDKLLNYLGNSRGHHSSHALEIPPEHAHNRHHKDSQRQHLQAKLALRCIQKRSREKAGSKKVMAEATAPTTSDIYMAALKDLQAFLCSPSATLADTTLDTASGRL